MATITKSASLLVAGQSIEANLPRLLSQPGQVVVFPTRLNNTRRGQEILCDEARPVALSQLPAELARTPRAAVIAVPDSQAEQVSAAALASQYWRPELDSLVVFTLGFGEGLGAWDVAGRSYQGPLAIEQVRVVGPGMLRLRGDTVSTVANDEFHDHRWSRERHVVPQALAQAPGLEVMIIGCSGTGALLGWQLAAMLPIGRLVLVDPKPIARHHLSRMPLVDEQDVGRPKVQAVAQKLLRLRSDLAITCLRCSASDDAVIDAARHMDLLITACDTLPPRELAAHLSRTFLIPHLDVGTGIHDGVQAGDVRLLLPGHGCAVCVGDTTDRNAPPAPPGPGGTEPTDEAFLDHRDGSLLSLNGINVSTAVGLVIDLLEGRLTGSVWHRMRWVNGRGIEATSGPVDAAPGCKICHGRPVSWN